jgi:quinoprotein glucose dehydrogenase
VLTLASRVVIVAMMLALWTACAWSPAPAPPPYDNWPAHGGIDNTRYSTLSEITPANVGQLQAAWTYDSGDSGPRSEIEANPVVIDGMLFLTTATIKVVALNAETGVEMWRFDPDIDGLLPDGKSRGVTVHRDRIFVTFRWWLWALDRRTGRPIRSFGAGGRVDLRDGLGTLASTVYVRSSTPAVVFDNLLILPTTVPETLPGTPGHIRAFDTTTGEQRWIFHTIPQPSEFGYDTWPPDAYKISGGANAWGGITVDSTLGLVYAATGSASFDFYGSQRHGDNLFANCVLALDARTGRRVWHFQGIRHDVWDQDFPAAPSLVTVTHNGRPVEAVAQVGKHGYVFVLDRRTGESLFPIEDRAAPSSTVDGEVVARSQPHPLQPPPVARQGFTEAMITTRTPEAHAAALARFETLRSGFLVPPSLEGTILLPGMYGGASWGGAAFDPATGLLYVNAIDAPYIITLTPNPQTANQGQGEGEASAGALKYGATVSRFLDADGYPAITPPWGTLNALDLNSGTLRWKIPFGEHPELVAKGFAQTGSENYGGPIVTAGGVLFIGATVFDRKFHAYDKLTGRLLWETTLPAGGLATPSTYQVNGRQFVVIACGGGKNGTLSSGKFVAFALPRSHD